MIEDELGEVCMWKTVVDKDKKKVEEGNDCVTFSPSNPCYECPGYNKQCDKYTPINMIADPVKYNE